MDQPTVSYAIFWNPPTLQDGTPSHMSQGYENLILRYLSDVGGSGLYNDASQYYQTTGGPRQYIVNGSSGGKSWDDPGIFPPQHCMDPGVLNPSNCVTAAEIQSEIQKAMRIKHWTGGLNHLFFVFLPYQEGECNQFGECELVSFCAYHWWFSKQGVPVIYAPMAYAGTNLDGCGVPSTPNGDRSADAEVSMLAHEQIEAITDPEIQGWYDDTGIDGEIGDKCRGSYGSINLDHNKANQNLNGHYYIIQEMWDNEQNECVQREPFTQFPVLAPANQPGDVATNADETDRADGTAWFTESGANEIAHISVAGVVTQFAIPTANSFPGGITVDPDGNVWFTERSGNKIGRLTPSGSISEFPIPTSNSDPGGIALGPDGTLWFIEDAANKIGRITPAGSIAEYTIPTSRSTPEGITAGADGNVWFTETAANKIGRISPSGSISEYTIPTPASYAQGITAGADGNVWFTELLGGGGQIGRITPSGTVTEFPVPAENSRPSDITADPTGNLWVTDGGLNALWQVTPSGTMTEYPIPAPINIGGQLIAFAQTGDLWITQPATNQLVRFHIENLALTPTPTATATATSTPTPTSAAGNWTAVQSMSTARYNPAEVVLQNGLVLVAGGADASSNALSSAELYNPSTGIWTSTGSMHTPRFEDIGHDLATLLPNGEVLVAGGCSSGGNCNLTSAELYDPTSGLWSTTGSMNTAHNRGTTTLLANGTVLVAGGASTNTAEIYSPATGTWSFTGQMTDYRYGSAAALLANGEVLVAGGTNLQAQVLTSAELYNPATGTWTSTGSMLTGRYVFPAVRLANGEVLVAGGSHNPGPLDQAELYDPTTGTWGATESMATARINHTMMLLDDGQVLVAGGSDVNGNSLASAELYNPSTAAWLSAGSMTTARQGQAAALLNSGQALVVGGLDSSGLPLSSAEVYTP